MFTEPALDIGRNAGIEVPLLISDNINKPGCGLHAKMIATMDRIKIPFSEFTFSYARSSGAGGQNVNKVNSKVIMTWKIDESPSVPADVVFRFKDKYGQFIVDSGEVQIVSQKHRSQKSNMDDCIEKLHDMLNAEGVLRAPRVRKKTKPKRSAVMKRLQSKRKDSEKKQLRRKDY